MWGDLVHSRVELSIRDAREKTSLLRLTIDARHMKKTHTDAHWTFTACLTGTMDAHLMLRMCGGHSSCALHIRDCCPAINEKNGPTATQACLEPGLSAGPPQHPPHL